MGVLHSWLRLLVVLVPGLAPSARSFTAFTVVHVTTRR